VGHGTEFGVRLKSLIVSWSFVAKYFAVTPAKDILLTCFANNIYRYAHTSLVLAIGTGITDAILASYLALYMLTGKALLLNLMVNRILKILKGAYIIALGLYDPVWPDVFPNFSWNEFIWALIGAMFLAVQLALGSWAAKYLEQKITKATIACASLAIELNILQIFVLLYGFYHGQVTAGTLMTEFALFIINFWWHFSAALAALLTWLDWLVIGASVLAEFISGTLLKVANLLSAISIFVYLFWETASDIIDPDPYASTWFG